MNADADLASVLRAARRILENDPDVRRLHRRARAKQYAGDFSLGDVLAGVDRLPAAMRGAGSAVLPLDPASAGVDALAYCRAAIWLALDITSRKHGGVPPSAVGAAAVALVRTAIDVAKRERSRVLGAERGAPDPSVSAREAERRQRVARVRSATQELRAAHPRASTRALARRLILTLGEVPDDRRIRAIVAFCGRNGIRL